MADDFERDDMDEEVPVITLVDDETGEETDCVVIVGETEDDITYSVVDDGEEFEAVAALFGNDEYDVEF